MRKVEVSRIFIEVIPSTVVAFARNVRGSFRRRRYFRRLRRLSPELTSDLVLNANMLVVQDATYVSVSRVCALSFLKFNPKSRITIHVDEVTSVAAEKTYRSEIRQGQIVLVEVDELSAPWQENKVLLICSLLRESDFYMDADLRWNGPLTLSGGLTFFVREFVIGENKKYAEAFDKLKMSWINQSVMKNTSFFCWGNLVNQNLHKKHILTIYHQILAEVQSGSLESKVETDLTRLSEQIAFSAALSETETGLTYLKDKDGQMDGSFLESSYYGATGTSF